MTAPELSTIWIRALCIILISATGTHPFAFSQDLPREKTIPAKRDSLEDFIRAQFGPDQDLLNGYQYFEAYGRYKGSPYLNGNDFFKGSITRKGRDFTDLRLKYDCYAQLLVIEYHDIQSGYKRLMITKTGTDSFQLGALDFVKVSLSGEDPAYYQVIREEPITGYVRWTKEPIPLSTDLKYAYEFSRARPEVLISFGGRMQAIQSLKSYTDLFPNSDARTIRKYCRQARFRFSRASPGDLRQLFSFTARTLTAPQTP